MNISPLVSVVVPVYKVEEYLNRCVDSILKQTYTSIEIILVDDGSPDNCPLICDQYASLDSRVLVIHQDNLGLSGARNAGIRIAKGEYIAFVDSDDYISANYISKLLNTCIRYDAELSMCSFNCNMFPSIQVPDGLYSGYEILSKTLEFGEWWNVVAWNKLYKRNLLTDDFYPIGKINEDEFVFHSLVLKCDKIALCSDKLYFYCLNPNSITQSSVSIRNLDLVEALTNRLIFIYSNTINDLITFASDNVLNAFIKTVSNIPISELYLKNNLRFKKIYANMMDALACSEPFLTKKGRVKYILIRLSPVLFSKLIYSFLSRNK